ncbi:hypothetical protein C8R44DRAFT_882859 [Mycena epipterygia]|nr:hypothetical protein C8R44DRAFT_882859 [Mycena epipterygia]
MALTPDHNVLSPFLKPAGRHEHCFTRSSFAATSASYHRHPTQLSPIVHADPPSYSIEDPSPTPPAYAAAQTSSHPLMDTPVPPRHKKWSLSRLFRRVVALFGGHAAHEEGRERNATQLG